MLLKNTRKLGSQTPNITFLSFTRAASNGRVSFI